MLDGRSGVEGPNNMLTATESPLTIDMTSARKEDTGYSSTKPGMMRGEHMSGRDEVKGVRTET